MEKEFKKEQIVKEKTEKLLREKIPHLVPCAAVLVQKIK